MTKFAVFSRRKNLFLAEFKRFDSSKIRNLIEPFVTFNVFPNFIHTCIITCQNSFVNQPRNYFIWKSKL